MERVWIYCETCNGSGRIREVDQVKMPKTVRELRALIERGGRGCVRDVPCPSCEGRGRMMRSGYCEKCTGDGYYTSWVEGVHDGSMSDGDGGFSVKERCEVCVGTGRVQTPEAKAELKKLRAKRDVAQALLDSLQTEMDKKGVRF